ncbi:MAG: hypothetical protein HYT77_02290 [Deltaproteobacteria bacterium]|nr:hypothetical protein [Deltaproteobacteria bacterium]
MEEPNKIAVPLKAVEDCVDCKEIVQKLVNEGRKDIKFDEGALRTSFLCPHPCVCYFHEQYRILKDANRRIEAGASFEEQNKIVQEAKHRIAEHLMTGGFVPADDWDDPSDNINRAIKDFEEYYFEGGGFAPENFKG